MELIECIEQEVLAGAYPIACLRTEIARRTRIDLSQFVDGCR